MLPGGIGYSDTPTFGGFGPKSPCSEHAMELADTEAAFLGNVANYCIKLGTIPRISLRPFWFVNGSCLGIRALGHDEDEIDLWGEHTGHDYLAPIYSVVDHLVQYAPFILGTEGIGELLKAGQETRWYSEKMFPQEEDQWVNIDQAKQITGRSEKTLHTWRRAGWVKTITSECGTLFSHDGLTTILNAMNGKRTANLPNGK